MIEITPSKQLFVISSISPLKYQMILKNISSSLIAFKIKSTAIQHFFVTPSIGQLQPNKEQVIEFKTKKIKDQIKDIQPIVKAKFLIESKEISKQKQSNDDAIWNDKPNIIKTKLKLNWQGLKTETITNNKKQQQHSNRTQPQKKVVRNINRNKQFIVLIFLFAFGIGFGYILNWYDGKRKLSSNIIQTNIKNNQNHNMVQNENQKLKQIIINVEDNTDKIQL